MDTWVRSHVYKPFCLNGYSATLQVVMSSVRIGRVVVFFYRVPFLGTSSTDFVLEELR